MKKLILTSILTLGFAVACSSAKKMDSADAKTSAPATAEAKSEAKAESGHAKKSGRAAKAEKAVAAKSSSASVPTVVCTSGSEERKIEVVDKSPGCELNYTKGGQSSMIASSGSTTGHCEGIKDRIKGKLEAAGYSCQ